MTFTFHLIEQFADRPTLRTVAADALREALAQAFPALKLDPDAVRGQHTSASGVVTTKTLTDWQLQLFCRQATPVLKVGSDVVLANSTDTQTIDVDLARLAQVMDIVTHSLLDEYAQRLARFWYADGSGAIPRWQWLAQSLCKRLTDDLKTQRYEALSDDRREVLRRVSMLPVTRDRATLMEVFDTAAPDAIGLFGAYLREGRDEIALPALILQGRLKGEDFLLCLRPCGEVLTYADQPALLTALRGERTGDLQWRWVEIDTDCFEALSQWMLESQLREVLAMKGADAYSLEQTEQYLASITDVYGLVAHADDGAALSLDQLPSWLRDASSADRLAFSLGLTRMAAALAHNNGEAFDDGLPPILTYALEALNREIQAHHPEAGELSAEDIEIEVDEVIAAPMPAGGSVFNGGAVRQTRLSLSTYALDGLASKPGLVARVSRKTGRSVPDWLTVEYVRRLTTELNIGQTYPRLIRQTLINDPVEAARRQTLFAEQMAIQLPLKVLELKLKGECGVDGNGVALMRAITANTAAQRLIAGQPVVLRPLAFIAQPGANDDVVSNVFLIERRDAQTGPVLLYRPFSPQVLTQFASRTALLDVIAAPGDLQEQVLTWLCEPARARYANGGFVEPHIVRFGQGSDFAPITTPAPAEMSLVEVKGEPLQALFSANAQALVELADQSSVSNAESRWANLKECGWLLLNAVLPLVGGMVANAVWLTQLASGFRQWVAARGNPEAEGEALRELLMNVALLLLNHGLPKRGSQRQQEMIGRKPLRLSAAERPATIDTVEAVAEPLSQVQRGELDFTWSSAVDQLSVTQTQALQALSVEWAQGLGELVTDGVHKGLYSLQGKWYARIDASTYRVESDIGGVQIIDDADSTRRGPMLKREGDGWAFDLALRLKGGAPGKRAQQLAAENAAFRARAEVLQHRQHELTRHVEESGPQLSRATGDALKACIDEVEVSVTELTHVMYERLALAEKMRPGDRPSDARKVREFIATSRSVFALEGAWQRHMLEISAQGRPVIDAMGSAVLTAQEVDSYLALNRQLLLIHVRGVHWSGIRELMWKQLREVPNLGEAAWRKDVHMFQHSDLYSHFEWQMQQSWALLNLSFGRDEIMSGTAYQELRALRQDGRLLQAADSQNILDRSDHYSRDEQIQVLESCLREYERAADIVINLQLDAVTGLHTQYLGEYLKLIGEIGDRTQERLSDLISRSLEPAPTPHDPVAEWVPAQAVHRTRVFKAPGNRTLVGRVHAEPGLHGDIVKVGDDAGAGPVRTYHDHGAQGWIEVVTAPQGPTRQDSVRPLGELKRQARQQLDDAERAIGTVERQSRTANEPQDMEDILLQRADKLAALAGKIAASLAQSADDETVGALQAEIQAEIGTAIERLKQQGRAIRIAMIKRQPPTAGRVSYLLDQREISIASQGGRKNMSGARRDDFLQEYLIRDSDHQPLWWAHFHYAREDAPADAFTVAHLKLPAQRKLGYAALVKATQANPREVVSIYRSNISRELAQRLFLPSAPASVAHD
jgi:hypothetical protein